ILFASEINVDIKKLEEITDECTKRGIFSKELYEKSGILTSAGIQKRYKEIVRRRKGVEVTEEYLLVRGLGVVNDVNNPSSSEQDDGKSTQRKGKESKGKESNKSRSKLKFETHHFQLAELLNKVSIKNNEIATIPTFDD